MSILVDIGVNLLAAFLGFGIGWLFQKLRQAIKSRRARSFWRTFIKGGGRIVVGRFTEFTPFEGSGFVGVGDARGLIELQSHFESLGLRNLEVAYAGDFAGDNLKTNLLLLGGPDANSITREAMPRTKTMLRFGDPEMYEIAITDSSSGMFYAPSTRPEIGQVNKDYGLIVKAANPFEPSKCVLLIAGSFGFGTWAGVRLAVSERLMNDPIVLTNSSFECLFEVDVYRESPQDIRVIMIREIST